MKKENAVLIKNLSAAIYSVLENVESRELISNQISFERKQSKIRNSIYQKYCDKQWKTLIWCYCSLNTKQSKNTSPWVFHFKTILHLLDPNFLKKSFHSDNNKIFYAINLVLHRYAKGRFLTIKGNHSYQRAKLELEKINQPTRQHLIDITNKISISKTLIDKTKVDSKHLFDIFKKSKFSKSEINKQYQNLDLTRIKPDDLIEIHKLKGINSKYSRNILMDIRNSHCYKSYYAVDSRIKGILNKYGYRIKNKEKYSDTESLLEKIREELNQKINKEGSNREINKFNQMDSWTLDRMLFTLSGVI